MSDTYYLVAADQSPRKFPETEPLIYERVGGTIPPVVLTAGEIVKFACRPGERFEVTHVERDVDGIIAFCFKPVTNG